MRHRNSRRRIACLFLSAAAIGMAQQTGSLTGRVTNSATGKPVAHAHVSLGPQIPTRPHYGALTDEEGRFSIGQLPREEYRVSVDAPGFEIYRLTLPAGQRDALDVALAPFGAISGRVIDAEGRAVQGVAVSAMGPDGLRDGGVSDPDGQYRVGSLPSGKYRLRAAPRALNLAPEVRSDGTTEVRYVTTYFPASLSAEAAETIDLAPGMERTGTDVRLLHSGIVAVRGTVPGMPAGQPYIGISAHKVEPPHAQTYGVMSTVAGVSVMHRVNPDGSFEIWGLDPGEYILTASSNGPGWQSPAVRVTVADKDVDGIVLGIVSPFDISGRIMADDDGSRVPNVPPNTPVGGIPRISLRNRTGGGGSFSTVAADGSFHLNNVQPGQYSVFLSWGPYVKSMRLGSSGIEGKDLDLRNGAGGAALTVTASFAFAQISGVVRNGAAPAVNARVALVSEDTRMFAGIQTTGADGDYTFARVAPGAYTLVAQDAGVTNVVQVPNEQDYADIAESVEVHAGDRLTRDLRQHAVR